MTRIVVDDVVTSDMLDIETKLITGERPSAIALAGFVSLVREQSPYVTRQPIKASDRVRAAYLLTVPDRLDGEDFDNYVGEEMEAIFRAFGIIVAQPHSGRGSDMPPFGPEWITNIMAAAADAMPSLTIDDILHKQPMVLVAHLAAASHRRNGGITQRPKNAQKALELLEQLNNGTE